MTLPTILDQGYARFLQGHFSRQNQRYLELSQHGQSPSTMVIACCDSRVDPAVIFDAGPGELFVVRNVANLVPPCTPDDAYHGTSAAIEFAVNSLNVADILVLGHSQCGGVAAALNGDVGPDGFIGRWMSIMAQAKAEVEAATPPEHRQQRLEEAVVRASLANLMTFPEVAVRVMQGRLRLHGAHFGIADGHLTVIG